MSCRVFIISLFYLNQVPRSTLQRWNAKKKLEEQSCANSSIEENTEAIDDNVQVESEISDDKSDDKHGTSDDESGTSDDESETSDDSDADWEDEDCDTRHDTFSFMPEPLFSGSKLTAGEAVRQFLGLYSVHAMSKLCLKALVQLVHSLLPPGNNFPKSYYFLMKKIQPFIPPKLATVHTVCEVCGTYVGKEGGNNVLCPACSSEKLLKFQDLSVSTEIKYLFEKRNLADAIDRYRAINSDIPKSEEYRRLKAEFPGQYDIQLQWNFDGVAPHKSNTADIWPILYTICEVAPQERSSFTMVAGLWHDKTKPNINAYLIPFAEHLQNLCRNGVTWIHPRNNRTYVSKVIAPVLSVDAPA